MSWRLGAAECLGEGDWRPAPRVAVRLLLLAAVLASIGAAMLGSLGRASGLAMALAGATWLLFAIEYGARAWAAPAFVPNRSARAARWAYGLSFQGVVDLLVILPPAVAVLLPVGDGPVLLAQLLALVKLARLLPGLGLVASVFRREARPLFAGLTVLLVLLVLSSGAMYLLERAAQPEIFASIPRTLWWGIVTIASVGYGDMVPVTPGGRLVAGAVMLLGIAMFAVPAGILATGFAEELRRRDFIVTWQAVAKVPLFARLDAGRIAEISRLLKPRIALPSQALCRRGEAADAMFFILEGEVEVDVTPGPVRLKPGQFFGEMALLKDTTRNATVTAIGECRLLVLGAADFRRLLAEFPDIAADIAKVAEERRPS
jgi:voltage-gated potassium channel